jgi:hypothetical protein
MREFDHTREPIGVPELNVSTADGRDFRFTRSFNPDGMTTAMS